MKTWSDEAVETELDRLVERHIDELPAEDELLRLTRRRDRERRERNRELWIAHCTHMAGVHRGLGDDYERRAKDLQKGMTDD